MAVAWFRNPVLDDTAPLIERSSVNERTFGLRTSQRHPAYVYSINKNACLMHKILSVEIHWYAYVGMHTLGRLKQPAMIAHTVCGVFRALTPDRSRTCHVPFAHAELCGRCHGTGSTFQKVAKGRSKMSGRTKAEAHVTLGCVVNGYPSALERALAVDAVDPVPASSVGTSTRDKGSSSFSSSVSSRLATVEEP